jgi:hypothetical protein
VEYEAGIIYESLYGDGTVDEIVSCVHPRRSPSGRAMRPQECTGGTEYKLQVNCGVLHHFKCAFGPSLNLITSWRLSTPAFALSMVFWNLEMWRRAERSLVLPPTSGTMGHLALAKVSHLKIYPIAILTAAVDAVNLQDANCRCARLEC